MAEVVKTMGQVFRMLSASRAIVLVSVPWSPWPRKSREVLAALESTQKQWAFNASVEFFDLWPESEEALTGWYEELCITSSPRFVLHGHGYGPLWWLAEGKVLSCLAKPYEYPMEELQQRSKSLYKKA
jgi:hypothetical protein